MTAGTADRQALGSPEDHVQPVVDDVGLAAIELPAEGQEPERRQVGMVRCRHCWSAAICYDQELIVGQIVVEGTDHPVAIGGGRRVGRSPLSRRAFRVGIAGDVQPVPGPALAKLAGPEQAVDQGGVRSGV